jgi:hypothetical protein
MAIMLSEVALQRMIQIGLRNLRSSEENFKDIFAQYACPEMAASYGDNYIQKIWDWFSGTKIPVLQAWSFDTSKVPGISIHLADESEDESKASMNDYFGMGENSDVKTGVVTVSIDIGIHADKSKDHVLWIYYILLYILYREKPLGRKLGLQLYTYRANDYNKESKYMADNVWSRWVRFRCTVQHYVSDSGEYITPDIELDIDAAQIDGSNITDISNAQIDNDD